MLDELGWPGHFFITTGCIGKTGFLRPAEIVQLHKRGHIVGSHSHTHPEIISRLSDKELTEEWRVSVTTLSEIIGCAVTVASVPGGFFSRRVARAAAFAGIRYLFTSDPGSRIKDGPGCRLLPRYTLKQHMGAEVAAGLVYSYGNRRRSQYLAWNSRKLVKKISGPLYLKMWEWMNRDKQKDRETR